MLVCVGAGLHVYILLLCVCMRAYVWVIVVCVYVRSCVCACSVVSYLLACMFVKWCSPTVLDPRLYASYTTRVAIVFKFQYSCIVPIYRQLLLL